MTDTPNATAQAITAIFEKTIEVDPRRLVRVHELDNLRAYLANAEKTAEAAKGKPVKEGEESPEELRLGAVQLVAEGEAALAEYDAEGYSDERGERAKITIGYIPESVLTDYDLGDQTSMSMVIGSQERNEFLHDLARVLVMNGVKGHTGVVFYGTEVPYTECSLGFPTDEVVDLYSRAKWLHALMKAIYRHNTLAEEKKSK